MKNALRVCIVMSCVSVSPTLAISATRQVISTPAFQEGFCIVAVGVGQSQEFYYASAAGDVYKRGAGPWQGTPAMYTGNFFHGQPVPSDFVAGFHAAITDVGKFPVLYYASLTGDIYRQSGEPTGGTFEGPPNHEGNFFFNQPAPADFQKGFRISNTEVGNYVQLYYASESGDVYVHAGWDEPPAYLGNFFGGGPLPVSKSTWGSVKSNYAPKKP